MHFILVRDKGEYMPIGEYIPISTLNGDDIPVGAYEWDYLRIDEKVFKPLFDPTGNKLCEAHETEGYQQFMQDGMDHEVNPIQLAGYIDNNKAVVNDIEAVSLACRRYFVDKAYFITIETIEDLFIFMRKHSTGFNYEMGSNYEGGVWGDKLPIAYLIIDSMFNPESI